MRGTAGDDQQFSEWSANQQYQHPFGGDCMHILRAHLSYWIQSLGVALGNSGFNKFSDACCIYLRTTDLEEAFIFAGEDAEAQRGWVSLP